MPKRIATFRLGPARKHDTRPSSAKRLYGRKWRTAAAAFLVVNPLCNCCMNGHVYESATVVDHKIPHKGDLSLFWDQSNWQPLCKWCHDQKTAREDGGFGRAPMRKEVK